jgi:carbonic anhydrase
MNKIVVSCMDCRLNSKFDSENDGNVIFVRNAGGNINGVVQTLRYLLDNTNVHELHIVTHTDCGAMGYVFGVLSKQGGEDNVHSSLVDQFRKADFSDRSALEKMNGILQKENAEKLFSNRDILITTEYTDISSLQESKTEKEHVLIITKASRERYEKMAKALGEDISNCYVIQANSIEEVVPDIAIAVKKLGIKDIRVVALKPEEYRQMHEDAEKMRIRYSTDGIKISYEQL